MLYCPECAKLLSNKLQYGIYGTKLLWFCNYCGYTSVQDRKGITIINIDDRYKLNMRRGYYGNIKRDY